MSKETTHSFLNVDWITDNENDSDRMKQLISSGIVEGIQSFNDLFRNHTILCNFTRIDGKEKILSYEGCTIRLIPNNRKNI